MTADKSLSAPCGLYCGVCGVLYATRDDNHRFLEKLLAFYQGAVPDLDQLTIEDLKCDGCGSERVSFFCRVCAIKECCRGKDITGCHHCEDFPCRHIDAFPVPVGKKVILRAVPFRKAHGTDAWIAAETARYQCPGCAHTVFRGARRCNGCHAPVDLD
ncbi:MAG: DUF3795 domain-containing protein [Pseudomonadota bacterium]